MFIAGVMDSDIILSIDDETALDCIEVNYANLDSEGKDITKTYLSVKEAQDAMNTYKKESKILGNVEISAKFAYNDALAIKLSLQV